MSALGQEGGMEEVDTAILGGFDVAAGIEYALETHGGNSRIRTEKQN